MFMSYAIALLLSIQSASEESTIKGISGQERDPIEIARVGADLAGAAYYCKADTEDVDLLVVRIEGLIAARATDNVQSVFAKLEFKNRLTATRSKAPKTSCNLVIRELAATLEHIG